MEKRCTFLGRTEQGVSAQALFGSSGCFEKTGGAAPFSDWETGEELRRFIKTITKDDRKRSAYVLVNALGAGEYFGSNINADYFPWEALSHEGEDYGYRTFLKAHAFRHHKNRPHEGHPIYGEPVLSVLNRKMKRVELVVRLDREWCSSHNATDLLGRIEGGEFPDVSMGCKVPYDVCSICGNKSKTRDDYCEHMRPPAEMRGLYGPNKILPDGRKIYVLNLTPRFFDISFVFIGADKTAKVMAKLASKGPQLCIGSVCATPSSRDGDAPELFGPTGERILPSLRKVASSCDGGMRGPCGRLCSTCADVSRCHTDKLAAAFAVKSAQQKKAEIVKQVPASGFTMKTLPQVEKGEPDIDRDHLDELAEHPLPKTLGGAARLGIVLKPHEFQRIVLVRMGERGFADDLDSAGCVFPESKDTGSRADVDVKDPLDAVFRLLRQYTHSRTALGEPFSIRVVFAGGAKKALPTREPFEDALLHKVSAAYNAYRRSLVMKLSQAVEEVEGDPKSRETIRGDEISNMFKKTASSLVSLDTVAYVMGAHFQDRSLLYTDAAVAAINEEWLFGASA